ncbi:MFS transporter [Pseudorhodoplanes sp.]|uniref:MFS transporter n=1 Tax=Pseudorhodoplanes sp. TaxID=1934341 RepID=UPI002B930326|nr:MFS transporter [Pseudorhodoplanes sp.]HWV40200.1 MFS transporter [Pseudorhodoplanes sp.]
MTHLSSRLALLSGNFITGLSVLAPAGMLTELAAALHVTVRDIGLLVTYGAVVLCLASPLVSWLTARVGRRLLMSGTLAVVAAGHFLSASVDSYVAILGLRLAMLALVAIYTPQAASTMALIAQEKERPAAIAFVFLGWSLAIAVGLPLITMMTSHFGWREAYAAIGLAAAVSAALNFASLPSGLQGHPLSLQSFVDIGRNRTLILILLITLFQMSGQFSITVYMAALVQKVAGGGPAAAGILFTLLGVAGLIGNLAATRIVQFAGVNRTLGFFIMVMMAGGLTFSLGNGVLAVMAAGVFILGLGITAGNTMQQARLVTAAPLLATATVALNTSVLYVGQALGSGAAGILYQHEYYRAIGFVSVVFFALAFAVFTLSRVKSQSVSRSN